MKQYRLLITFCIVVLGITSCNPQPEADRLLRLAQDVVETNADSAMNLIDSIYYPENSLSHKRYMEFLVTRTQTKHKIYRPIDEDTIVFKARDYFDKINNNPEITALAWYYSGCVYREQKMHTEAMHHYKEAERYSLLTNNLDLKGLIQYNMGDLLSVEGLHMNAIEYYKKGGEFYIQSPNKGYIKQSHCFGAIGRMFMLEGKPDSAFYYFNNGLEIVKTYNDTKLQSQLEQNISIFYSETEQYDKAKNHLINSYQLKRDSTDIERYYLNFAKLYSKLENADSTLFYVERIKQYIDKENNNKYLKASIYFFLANFEKDNGNYDDAFHYQDKYTSLVETITSDRLEQSIYETNIKYDYAQAQNKVLKSQMSTRTLFGVVSLLFTILFIVLTIWRKQKKTAHLEKDYTEAKLLLSQQKTEEKQRIISVALPYLNLHSSIQNQLLEFASKVRGKDKKLGDALDELLKGNRSAFNDTTQQIFTDELMHDVVGISKGLELLNPSDRLLILMLAIDVDNNNIAALLNTTPMNLKSKKSYLKKKLQNNADQFDNYDFLISIF